MEIFLAIGGAIVLAGNVGAVIFKVLHPAFQVRKDVNVLQDHDKKDYETLKRLDDMNHAQCEVMLCIINHMIDGNGKEEMKNTRKKLMHIINSR